MEEEIEFEEKRSGCWGWLVRIGLLLAAGYLFREELGIYLRIGGNFLKSIIGWPEVAPVPGEQALQVTTFVLANAIGLALLAVLMIVIFSQVALPVSTGHERWQVAERIFSFLTGFRTPLIYVREGKYELPEKTRQRGGIALVDANSALVLERQWGSLFTSTTEARRPMMRVAHPGVVFIGKERLREAISLRKQFRINPGVRASTRDGIELETNIVSIFSISQPPTIIKVAYCPSAEEDDPGRDYTSADLRVLQIDPASKTIKSIRDELDQIDREEIHRYAQRFLVGEDLPAPLEPLERTIEHPPYVLDDERILAASYFRARRTGDGAQDQWTDLPTQVGTEVFRNMIAQVRYDELYHFPDDPQRFPLLDDFKPRFQRTMRFMGVMSYQFIYRGDGSLPEVGQKVDLRQFRISPVQKLQSHKTLRDRGIKIILPSFSSPRTTDPAVRDQRLQTWRSRWQEQIETMRAEQEYEAMRIFNRERAERQREMLAEISAILQKTQLSEEALVLRIFQVLEDIATDPEARHLLPQDTINILRNMRLWLLPDQNVLPSALMDRLTSGKEE
ncbi:MAG: hypothetical protein JXB15_15590 [Anaerolineales bacterium]|nr:hypothetical protein [Anaerolineales bacterium]